MNTAPNRRASDNASSPPGTSPTRRFSDMLKEGNGGGGPGIKVIRPENIVLEGELVITDQFDETNPDGVTQSFTKLDIEMELGDILVQIVEPASGIFTCKILGTSEEGVLYSFFEALEGLNPELVSRSRYTLASYTSAIYITGLGFFLPSSAEVIPGRLKDK